LHLGFDAGPVPDMGAYPINAARNIFGLEPTEVTAIGFKTPGREFLIMDHDTIQVTLRFPGDRVAQFIVGYCAPFSEGYKVVGTRGTLSHRSFKYVRKTPVCIVYSSDHIFTTILNT
jgi:glucose-fructose oxidoreductase